MIGIDLASRMSSVFGLKDKPRMAVHSPCSGLASVIIWFKDLA